MYAPIKTASQTSRKCVKPSRTTFVEFCLKCVNIDRAERRSLVVVSCIVNADFSFDVSLLDGLVYFNSIRQPFVNRKSHFSSCFKIQLFSENPHFSSSFKIQLFSENPISPTVSKHIESQENGGTHHRKHAPSPPMRAET